MPRRKTRADRGGRRLNCPLREQRSAAQHIRVHHPRETLFSRQLLGVVGALESPFGLAKEKVENRVVDERDAKAERVVQPLRELHSLAQAGHRLVGIAQQPVDLPSVLPCANSGIMPAIEIRERAVPLKIIEAVTFVAMAAGWPGLPCSKAGEPG